jgi:hypothetical protein
LYGGFETQRHTGKAKKDGHKATGQKEAGPAAEARNAGAEKKRL